MKNRHWQGYGNRRLVVALDETYFRKAISSDESEAVRLLGYYFDGLSKVGFRKLGSPGVTMINGKLQYANNIWFIENDSRFRIRRCRIQSGNRLGELFRI